MVPYLDPIEDLNIPIRPGIRRNLVDIANLVGVGNYPDAPFVPDLADIFGRGQSLRQNLVEAECEVVIEVIRVLDFISNDSEKSAEPTLDILVGHRHVVGEKQKIKVIFIGYPNYFAMRFAPIGILRMYMNRADIFKQIWWFWHLFYFRDCRHI